MKIVNRTLSGFLLLVFLLYPPTAGSAGEKPSPRGNKVLLSLRIAKARKKPGGIGYYKSILRQQKNRRPATARPRSSVR